MPMSNNKQIIERFFRGKSTLEEEKKLFQWLNEDIAHTKAFLGERKIYDLNLMFDDEVEVPAHIDIDNEYHQLEEYIRKEKNIELENRRANRKKTVVRYLFPIAACVAVFLCSVLLFRSFYPQKENKEIVLTPAETSRMASGMISLVPPSPKNCKAIDTYKGDRKKITLPDHTTVWINSKSELKYPPKFNEKLREVWLEGEAYFEVSHNPNQQFIVHTREFDIKVYGTSFNVSAYNGYSNKSYTLVEGSIQLSSNMDPSFDGVYLTPGQQAVYDSGKLAIKDVNPSLEISWREGKFYFRGKSFREICQQLEIAFDVSIRIEGDSLKNSVYTGDFVRDESLDQILSIMSSDRRMEYIRNGKTVLIKEKS